MWPETPDITNTHQWSDREIRRPFRRQKWYRRQRRWRRRHLKQTKQFRFRLLLFDIPRHAVIIYLCDSNWQLFDFRPHPRPPAPLFASSRLRVSISCTLSLKFAIAHSIDSCSRRNYPLSYLVLASVSFSRSWFFPPFIAWRVVCAKYA